MYLASISAARQKLSFRYIKRHIRPSRVLLYIVIIALVAFTSLPILYVVVTAFKPLEELLRWPPRFFVRNPTLENFSGLLTVFDSQTVPFTRIIWNSLFVTGVVVIGTVIVSSLGAYSIAKLKPRGSKLISNIVIAALMFSVHVTLIPNYIIVNNIGMMDSIWALIIPKIAVAYNFFLMQQFMVQIPTDVLEAARIDGSGEFRIFWRIVMPNLKPAWATLVVFSFISNWNDYMSPLIFIQSDDLKTIPLALQTIGTSLAVMGKMAAATFILIIPTIVLFTLMQKKVMETMMYSGIKG